MSGYDAGLSRLSFINPLILPVNRIVSESSQSNKFSVDKGREAVPEESLYPCAYNPPDNTMQPDARNTNKRKNVFISKSR